MDLIDRLLDISRRTAHIEHLQTEEATKMALVVPFIQALGYDTWNPLEVVPEFTADVGTKKGEKVDYAIMKEGEPILLFECKKAGTDLATQHASQLFRYFSVTPARVGILTDGVLYRFFSDLDAANKMDERPFWEIDIRSMDERTAKDLKRFAKQSFDIDNLLTAAEEMKYTRHIKAILEGELLEPSEDLVRLFTSRVYEGQFRKSTKEKFAPIVKKALNGFIDDLIEKRFRAFMDREKPNQEATDEENGAKSTDGGAHALPEGVIAIDGDIVTTTEELEAFLIVKAIVASIIEPSRVKMRDGKSYCSVLLDDTNRKPVCRLRFNSKSKRYLGLFDAEKNENKVEIATSDDIYRFSDQLRRTVSSYLDGKANDAAEAEA